MKVESMEERKKRVLNAIINDYIANAEPVGSRTITKKYALGVSPATVRNEMSDLEEEGYIEQPHTSAGRIPSGKGYRYYVDHLMEKEPLSPQEIHQIRKVVAGSVKEMESFMRSCCNMLSRLTNYATIASIPEQGHGRVENIQLLSLSEHQVLLILVASTGIIRHKLIELPLPVTPAEVAAMERDLLRNLIGCELRSINYDKLRDLLQDYQAQQKLATKTLELLEQALSGDGEQRIFIGGVMHMLSQPEFRDVDKLKNLFSIFEQDKRAQELIDSVSSDDGMLTITIGSEMPQEDVQDCSMIVANYFVNGEKAGSIGVLGPTRMSYGKTVSLMEQLSAELSKAMSDKKKAKYTE